MVTAPVDVNSSEESVNVTMNEIFAIAEGSSLIDFLKDTPMEFMGSSFKKLMGEACQTNINNKKTIDEVIAELQQKLQVDLKKASS